MASMTRQERQLFSLASAFKRYGKRRFSMWMAGCAYRGKTYTVLGCSAKPRAQFQAAIKSFPPGVEIESLHVGTVPASMYLQHVETFRGTLKMVANNWGCRPVIQVGLGDNWPEAVWVETPGLFKDRYEDIDDWLNVRPRGRPRKPTAEPA